MRSVGFDVRFRSPVCVLASALFVVSARPSGAQTPLGCRIEDFPAPALCARAGLDTVPASHLIILDTSGSMRPVWPAVRAALREFAGAIPDGDELDVRLFAGGVGAYLPPTRATPDVRDEWKARMSELPSPNGAHTDLGRASNAVIETIRAAPAEQLLFIFFLTDGKHDPQPGSRFGRSWDQAWQALEDQVRALTAARSIWVGIVRLSPEADHQFLTRVFPSAVVTDAIGQNALRNWFDNKGREVAVSKLRQLIDRELQQIAFVASTPDPVRLLSDRPIERELPFTTDRTILQTVLRAPSAHTLPDGGSIAIRDSQYHVDSPSTGRLRVEIRDRSRRFWLPPGIVRRTIDTSIHVPTRLEPATELARIGVPPERTADTVRLHLSLAGGGILPWPIYLPTISILAGSVAYLLLVLRWSLHRAYLHGRIIIRKVGSQDESSEGQSVVFNGRRLRDHTVTNSNGMPVLRLEARKARGKTVLYAVPLDVPVRVRGKSLTAPAAVDGHPRYDIDDLEIQYFSS